MAVRRVATFGGAAPVLSPDSPTVLTLKILYRNPGKPLVEQVNTGRWQMMTTPFSTYEKQIREQLTAMFARTGFDARRDIETIQIELALADLATVERRRERVQKGAKGGEKMAKAELEVLDKLQPALEEFQPAKSVSLNEDELVIARNYFLLTMKPTIYAANVNEATLSAPDGDHNLRAIREVAASEGSECIVICAQLEADLVGLAAEEQREYLESLGVKSSGVDQLIRSAYRMLGLMSFLTAGEKEVRAWTIPQGSRAQDAAGAIHSDIARGFIRAEIVSYDDLIGARTYATAREKGLLRLEGKDYIMQEGDVVNFRFNV